jgi:hypothetical protein
VNEGSIQDQMEIGMAPEEDSTGTDDGMDFDESI